MKKLIFLLSFMLPVFLPAQDTTKYKQQENFKREIVIGDKRYRVYDNWVSAGVGGAYHSNNPRTQFLLGLNFNFHIKRPYFRAGLMASGDSYGQWNNFQAHLGYIPIRRQTEKTHYAVITSISYSRGYRFLYAGHYYPIAYNEVGFYAEFQFVRKIEYTTGFGGAVFFDLNRKNLIAGLRLDGYLSGAYRGYVRGKEPPKR